ncbi:hypothetical protein [Nocardioides daphniae]|uniref:hypothetical protein n=1 Tax=Nocardioides daphniae TaxID=402297 RepID=UPI001EE94922|nr:hypothetical protein [Nocardioides daphniae]
MLEATADGTLLRGEVLVRWQEFVGTGELLKSLENRVGWLRDRVVNAVKGKPQQAERVTVAVESGLETLLLEHAEAAAEAAQASWNSLASGQGLLADAGEDLSRASRDFRRKAERAVRDWQSGVLEMVRTEGADKRTTARFLAYGVNGLSVALMVVVFAHTGGMLVGAEVGVAGGGALLGQKLLEAVSVTRRCGRWPPAPAVTSSDASTSSSRPNVAATPTCWTRWATPRVPRRACVRPPAGSTTCASPSPRSERRGVGPVHVPD